MNKEILKAAILSGGSLGSIPSYKDFVRVELDEESGTYIAPEDGEFSLFVQTADSGIISANAESSAVRHCTNVRDGSTWRALRKGESCVYSAFGSAGNYEQYYLVFCRNVGTLVRGGLSPLFTGVCGRACHA